MESLFHFCPSSFSLQTLVVGSSLELNVTVSLWNEGEDSYGTVVHFYYPAGLSYRRVLETQVNSSLVLLCLFPALGYSRFFLILMKSKHRYRQF